jgi:sigma-B regulation protein RsbU (phosphoserine phosphatase)
MFASAQPFTVDQILQALQHDGPYLFLGSAFTVVGMVTAIFAFVERKFNAMLFWLGLFSILYGLRLCLQMPSFELMLPQWQLMLTPRPQRYSRLVASINYLVPIPAFFYFQTAGFLGGRGRRIAIPLALFFFALFVATVILGRRSTIDRI